MGHSIGDNRLEETTAPNVSAKSPDAAALGIIAGRDNLWVMSCWLARNNMHLSMTPSGSTSGEVSAVTCTCGMKYDWWLQGKGEVGVARSYAIIFFLWFLGWETNVSVLDGEGVMEMARQVVVARLPPLVYYTLPTCTSSDIGV